MTYALPTETWREVVARRTRYQEVWAKLNAGEVTEVNELITLNLDIERFARDVIAQSEGPELLRAFWHALYGNRERSDTGISVLDPTCGSGAFLFAALNVLEPLYTACLEGMRGFLDDAERSERKRSPEHLGDFRRILEQVKRHSGEEEVDERRNRALLHPQVHRAEQPLRRRHHGRGRGDLQAATLPEARRSTGELRPDRAAAGHRFQCPRRPTPWWASPPWTPCVGP